MQEPQPPSPQSQSAPQPGRRPIQVLSANVAERIAAGEVIERPASVVKELVENSLDAGATEVLVALEDGGKSLIEIVDNGHGMSPEDLALCVRRHATSKLSTVGDLEQIRTLGFRGEALPSVAAVSELSILSRMSGASGASDAAAYELKLPAVNDQDRFEDRKFEPEKTTFGHFLSSPHGTRIQARGLFAHIPARLKFLKSQGAEVAQVREWIERLALAHPRTGFRLLSDGRQILSLRPQEETARVRAILADGEDYPMLSANSDLGAVAGGLGVPDQASGRFEGRAPSSSGIHVRVHWLQGLSSPQMRKLVQVVNGRAVRDRMLQQALLQPFRQALLPGQFPAVALYIDIDPALLDVNVHPTKTEIRFLEGRKIFHIIDGLIDSLIAREGAPAFAAGAWSGSGAGAGTGSGDASLGSGAGATLGAPSGGAPLGMGGSEASAWRDPGAGAGGAFSWTKPTVSSEGTPSGGAGFALRPSYSTPTWSAAEPSPTHQSPLPLETHPADQPHNPLRFGRLAGTLFNTYFFYEVGDELALVDQHAAHERIRYEQLKKRVLERSKEGGEALSPSSQALLIPEVVKFPAEERATLEARLEWLTQLGFEAEVFGDDTALFRGVPAEWGLSRDLRTRLKNLVDRVLAQEASEPEPRPGLAALNMDESLFEALASEACHSAVRAGDRLETEEAASLIDQLFRCEHPWNCPHGRPTVVKVPRARFEEWFQRRV
jgi:DNA mismatch repair protein MutL